MYINKTFIISFLDSNPRLEPKLFIRIQGERCWFEPKVKEQYSMKVKQ